jgi:hypothetical protein
LRRFALLLSRAASLSLASSSGCTDAAVDIAATRPCPDEAFNIPSPPGAGLPNPASYTVNSDGTVTDDVTTLIWQRAVPPVSYRDQANASFPVAQNVYTQLEAAQRCASMGPGWRLPTRLELMTLVDYRVIDSGPTIDAAAFPDTPVDFPYWTSSPYVGFPSAWAVDFSRGTTIGRINVDDAARDLVAEKQLVRCVRWPAPRCQPDRFQLQPDGLAYDAATGRTWQQYVSDGGPGLPWDYATANCAGFGSGWRLPTVTELQSIVDDTVSEPAIDTTVFPTAALGAFWTSSPGPALQGLVFVVGFADGSTYLNPAEELGRVRCLR